VPAWLLAARAPATGATADEQAERDHGDGEQDRKGAGEVQAVGEKHEHGGYAFLDASPRCVPGSVAAVA
jgi:hypothetical protein